ncbi:replication termination factor 2 isoform X2 [Cottoperca gobio]|uniref:Replication termination factor 2 n=1 Tax=Cottoperca gobio TaxID=56716 RepID=A0A6J2PRL0_COTGO|nr:replication termination factor 2 isoform X2 [Cottoperca gobio]
MGCDGGTIPKRHELVKGPKKVEKVDKNAELAAKWKYCALSQEKLRRPIVACDVGRLYNKDAIIEYLLDKTAERPNAEAVTHIRGIRDIKELNLTDNPEWEGEGRTTKGDRYEDVHCGMFICPVVGLEMNGKHRFYYLQTCGCVFSDRALKEIKTDICHKCGDTFKNEDLIVLNGTKEEMDKLREKMEERRAKAKTKKSKKSKAAAALPAPSEAKDDAQSPQVDGTDCSLQNGDESSQSAAGSSSSSQGTSSTSSATKRSVQKMTEKSEVFKSLFTTHSSAKRTKAQTSNWVTHTPYHF